MSRSDTRDSSALRPSGPESFQVTRIYDVKALSAATLLCAAYLLVELTVGGVAQLALGLFVILLAPGYAVAALLFGAGSRLPWTVHLAVIAGLAVVVEASAGIIFFAGNHGGLTLNLLLGGLAYFLCLSATLIQWQRGMAQELSPIWGRLRRNLSLPGFSSGQRVAAYSLLAAILLTFGVIGYVSTIHPDGQPVVTIAVFGPNGETSSLPTGGSINETLNVIVQIGNDDTAQLLNLTVLSALTGSSGGPPSIVGWTMPLHLGSDTRTSEAVFLAAGASQTIPISFSFAESGVYTVTLTLEPPGASAPVESTLGETIS
jgi:hypothetical protein